MKLTENQLLIREGIKIVDAIGKTLAPLVEVVLHDLTQPSHALIAISNNLSGRCVGDPATEIGLARMADPEFPATLQNYSNRFPDGRPAKSTSIGLKNSRGEYVAAICLNVDISMLTTVSTSLNQLAQTQSAQVEITESLTSKGLATVCDMLENFAAGLNTTPHLLTTVQRREAVRQLSEAGVMELKNAQAMVAEVLGVARSTVYTYIPNQGEEDE